MKKTKKYAGISLGIVTTPLLIYGAHKINSLNNVRIIKQYNTLINSSSTLTSDNPVFNLNLNISLERGKISHPYQNLVASSNIDDGQNGTIFEDSKGNLWSMGIGKKLQVLISGTFEWREAGHNSNITDGESGTIFEDSNKNLWSMGSGTGLQVLWNNKTDWEAAPGTNITNGNDGEIFEDSKGTLWSMGSGSSSGLQKLEKNARQWSNADHNSNITNGYGGKIFEDSKGNLWSMGENTGLQELKAGETDWISAQGSNIVNGFSGSIIEDSQHNLWSMAQNSALQVLREGEATWESANHNSNIKNGEGGVIFEDSSGNLWSAGSGTALQVLYKNKTEWELAKHSNIKDGYSARIFEDSLGNLWATGLQAKLEVLKKGKVEWKVSEDSNLSSSYLGVVFEDSKGNLWIMSSNNSLQVKLFGFKNWINKYSWEDADANSNINDGTFGKMFQDSKGNLWSMASNKPLQVLRKGQTQWELAGHKSNIINGYAGSIIEDSNGNLWSMGTGTALQVLKKGEDDWKASTSSSIANGAAGVIFEDSQKNLWATGPGVGLQELKTGSDTWVNAKNSNIGDGFGATIFEDKSGNLWSMGNASKLQKLKSGEDEWKEETSSNITSGKFGTIFQDSQGTLWSMGNGTPLQKLKKGELDWKVENRNSKINDGTGGVVFEDSQGNLWAMAKESYLQVLRKGQSQWTSESVNNSKIKDGYMGVIFEDSNGNLWSMGKKGVNSSFDSPLQVLRKGKTRWEDAGDGSNIRNGKNGTIFEDSQGNLWSMAFGTKLQVSKKHKFINEKINISNQYKLEIKNNKFSIMGNYRKTAKFITLQYKLISDSNWKEFDKYGFSKDIVTSGEYQFKWVVNGKLKLSANENMPSISNVKLVNANDVTALTFTKKNLSYKDANDGQLIFTNNTIDGVKLQYKKDGNPNWEDVSNNNINRLPAGTYHLRYVLDPNYLWINNPPTNPDDVIIGDSNLIGVNPNDISKNPSIVKKSVSYIDANDGKIKAPLLPAGFKYVVTKDGNAFNGTDFNHLAPGAYKFVYKLKPNYILKPNTTLPADISLTIAESTLIGVDPTQITGNPTANKTTTSYIDANDGEINVPLLPAGFKYVVTKDGNVFNETNFNNLEPGVYKFVYQLKPNYILKPNTTLPADISLTIIESTLIGIDHTLITGTPTASKTITSYIGAKDGKITLPTTGLPTGVTIQISKGGTTVADLDNLEPGTYDMKYVLDTSKYVLKSGALPNLNSVDITESDITQIDGTTVTVKPTITNETTSFKGNNDGSITLPVLPEGVKLVVTKDGNAFSGTDFAHLKAGVYVFKYESKDKYIWKNQSKPIDVSLEIKESLITQIDGSATTAKPSLTKTTTSYAGANDGSITIPTLPDGVKLVVTKNGNAFNGTDFNNLEPGVYKFVYQLKPNYILKPNTTLPADISLTIIESTLIGIDHTLITGSPTASKTITSYIGAKDGKITLPTTGLPTGVTIQVSKGGTLVTDLNNLEPGAYDMKYVLDTSKYVLKSGALPNLNSVDIAESDITQIDGTTVTVKPTITNETTSFKGNNDGSITMPVLPEGVKLVVTKDGNAFSGTDFAHLKAGVYVFKYESKDKYIWKNQSKPIDVSLEVKESLITQIDGSATTAKPSLTKTTTSYAGANDGSITIPTLPDGVKLVVTKDGNAFNGTDFNNLEPGVYKFVYQLKPNYILKPNTTLPADISLTIIESTLIGIDHTLITGSPTVNKTITSYIGAKDGKITLPTTGLPTGVTIQVSKGGTLVTDLDNLEPGTYDMKYVLDTSKYVLKSGALPNLNSVDITESDITQIDGTTVTVKPTITNETTSFKGNNDGSITMPVLPEGVKLVVTKDGNAFSGTDFAHLKAGVYVFKYESKDKYIWKNQSKPIDVSLEIKESLITQIDGSATTAKPSLTKTTTSYTGANDGSITIPTLPDGVKLVVTKDGNAFNGTDFNHLAPGAYKFVYKLKPNYILKPNTTLPADISLTIIESTLIGIDHTLITGSPTVNKTITSYIGAKDGKITLPTTGLPTGVTIQVSKGGTLVTDLDNLEPGTYDMKYVLDTSKYALKSGALPNLNSVDITESDITQIDGTTVTVKPTITNETTSFKGNNDGSITMPVLPEGVKLVVTKDGNAFSGTDFAHLKAGVYVFKYESKDKYIWKNQSKPIDVSLEVKESLITQIDGSATTAKPSLTKTTTSYAGANDGSITIPTLPDGVKLVVTKDGNAFNGTDFNNLEPGVYKFVYQLKPNYILKPNTTLPADISLTIIESTLIGIDHTLITGTPTASKTITSYIGAKDGKITLPTTGLPTGVTIQVSKGGTLVTDLDNLEPGTYDMKYVLDTSKYALKSGALPNLNSVDITESDITQIDGTTVTVKPTITNETTSFKGNNDGSITMPVLPEGVKLVVTKDGNAFSGTDFAHLKAGVYVFKYESKDKYIWKNQSKPIDVSLEVKESLITQIDGSATTAKPSLTKTTTSYAGANDGSITIPTLPDGVKLVVTKDGNAFNGTDFNNLEPGVYKFVYQLKPNYILKPNTTLPADISLTIIESTLIGIDHTLITGTPTASKTITSYIGAKDGKITLPTTGLPTGVTIQVSKGGTLVTDLDNLEPGTYDMKYVLDTSKYALKSGALPNLNSVDITESDITQIDGTTVTVKPTITNETTSFKGNNDGSITMPVLPEGVKLVVTKDGNAFSGTDFAHLKAGVYVFKYESKDKYIWKNESKPIDVTLKIKGSNIVKKQKKSFSLFWIYLLSGIGSVILIVPLIYKIKKNKNNRNNKKI